MPMAGSSGNGSQLKVNKLKTYIWELVPLGLQIACNSTRGWNVPKGIQEAHSAPPLLISKDWVLPAQCMSPSWTQTQLNKRLFAK